MNKKDEHFFKFILLYFLIDWNAIFGIIIMG